jgi:hypothetical protein
MEAGLHFSEETADWWRSQDQEVKSFYEHAEKVSLESALISFENFIGDLSDDVHIWGNGSCFDNVITASAIDKKLCSS